MSAMNLTYVWPTSFTNVLLPGEWFGVRYKVDDPRVCALEVLGDHSPTVVDGDFFLPSSVGAS